MQICIYCNEKVKYYKVMEINDEQEISCNNCYYDKELDAEELSQDR